MSKLNYRRRGLSNVAAGIVLAVVTACALTIIVQWARTQVSRMPSRVAEGVAVAPHRIGSDLIIVNYGFRTYTARLINEDGGICSSPHAVQLLPRSAAIVTTSCNVEWVEISGNILRVVSVGKKA
ncbi:MAG: hypothetical protein QXS42_00495 [Zestosphaera sp.]